MIAGCGSPIGEQGSAIGRSACLAADYASTVPGNRFTVIVPPAWKRSTWRPPRSCPDNVNWSSPVALRVCRAYPIGSSGGAWSSDPSLAYKIHFVPQGISADLIATLNGHSREDVDAYAAESQRRAAAAWEKGYFDRSVVPVVDEIGMPLIERDEAIRPGTTSGIIWASCRRFLRAWEKWDSTSRPF